MLNEELEKQLNEDRKSSQDRDASLYKDMIIKDKLQTDNYSKCASKEEFNIFSKAVLKNIEIIMQEFSQQKLTNDLHLTRINANQETLLELIRQNKEYVKSIEKKHDDIFIEIKSLFQFLHKLEASISSTKGDLLSKFTFVEDEVKIDIRRISNDYPLMIESVKSSLMELIKSLSSKGNEKTFDRMQILERKLGELSLQRGK